MSLKRANPARGARGARKTELAGWLLNSEHTASAPALQVRRLISRFGWSEARARVVAELAFGQQQECRR